MSDRTAGSFASLLRLLLVLVAFGTSLTAPLDCALAAEQRPTAPLRVAVYDLPPYGAVGSDGALSGVSVDLWRRVAEELEWEYKLTPVSQMESIISGLEQGRFDAAIGAVTITPEREARVDFSYPVHRSGVAVALRKETGPLAAIASYVTAAADLGYLMVGILALLLLLGVVIWLVERPGRSGTQAPDDSVANLRDGLY
jgi:polar amino acid transport system substrate-binding protein